MEGLVSGKLKTPWSYAGLVPWLAKSFVDLCTVAKSLVSQSFVCKTSC